MNLKSIYPFALTLILSACSSAPFSYSQDRCLGQQNQCQASCTDLDFGPARAACTERCLNNENRCYSSGYEGGNSPLSESTAIGEARTRAEKEADYERYKAKKERERAEDKNN